MSAFLLYLPKFAAYFAEAENKSRKFFKKSLVELPEDTAQGLNFPFITDVT